AGGPAGSQTTAPTAPDRQASLTPSLPADGNGQSTTSIPAAAARQPRRKQLIIPGPPALPHLVSVRGASAGYRPATQRRRAVLAPVGGGCGDRDDRGWPADHT